MDLTCKSKSWAGNIFHQFESICHDVDDFMSKDTVKFVENRVQSVGTSVKRLYSHVVQDILPPSEDIVKLESPSVHGEQVDNRDRLNSLTNIETNSISVDEQQLSENQVSNDIIRNSDASSSTIGVEENITSVSIPLAASSTESAMFSLTCDEDNKYLRPTLTMVTEKRDFDHEKENKGFSDDLNTNENRSLFNPSACDALEKDGTHCDKISSNDEILDVLSSVQSPEHILSDISCDEEDKERGKGFLICSASPKSSNFLASSCANGMETDEFGVEDDDLNMEAVDLSPDVKNDETNVVLNVDFVHAASHRRRNFRYYKKLIHDALTSRKRLSKEYEHLAILYGDIDLEPNQHFEPSSVQSSLNTSVHAMGTQSFPEMSESEWELV